jgi:hypothetical protein
MCAFSRGVNRLPSEIEAEMPKMACRSSAFRTGFGTNL